MGPGAGKKINRKQSLGMILLGGRGKALPEFLKLTVDEIALVASFVAKIAMVSKLH